MEVNRYSDGSCNPTDDLTYWERVSTTRWGRYLTDIETRAINLATKMSGGPGTALDIGCDGGRWSTVFLTQGWKVICTDIRPKVLEICQCRLPLAKCILVKPTDTSLPCDIDAVNCILCMEADPVISSEWFIEEASRVLAAGGILVATINNK